MKFAIAEFTEGKSIDHNEDIFAYDDNTFVISDGATDKSNYLYEGLTGGEVAGELVVQVCLNSENTGRKLVNEITHAIHTYYEEHNPNAIEGGYYRFSATMTCAKIINDYLIITHVGDCGRRINNEKKYIERKKVDIITAQTRKLYIDITGDIDGGRDFIYPLLKNQYFYRNNPSHPLGYGGLDGTFVPDKYISIVKYDLKEVSTLELFTDGYYGKAPNLPTINSREDMHKKTHEEDPHKHIITPETKEKDDRTIGIIQFLHNE